MAQQTDHVPEVRNMLTAVEWFFDNLKNHEIQAEHFELYQQAKQIEKEQIIKAIVDWYTYDFESAEQYYKETYNK